MGVEPDDDTRARAYAAFCAVREPLDGSARSADARDRIRDFKRPEALDALPPDLRELWDWHVENQAGFARAPFDEQWDDFMRLHSDEPVPGLGIPARSGRRGHEPFHAAGVPLLSWWEAQGRKVTANRGYGATREGNRTARPSPTVEFLAAEFLMIARMYDSGTMEAYGGAVPQFDARGGGSRLLLLDREAALSAAFKAAQRHVRSRPTFR